MLNQKLTGAGTTEKTYVEDVFSTYLYTGNGSTQTINNGIDLAGKGGMVWVKERSPNGFQHHLNDTNRGAGFSLKTSSTVASLSSDSSSGGFQSFNSDGFSVGSYSRYNYSTSPFVSWTFRKAPKFFDVVTYTGNGDGSQTISHNLGSVPGMIITKATSTTGEWSVGHREMNVSAPWSWSAALNTTAAKQNYWSNFAGSAPTATQFYVGDNANINGATYVAYLFAHDTTTDGLIQCGSFTTDSNGDATVELGWEPQWLMVKASSAAENWNIYDNMRNFSRSGMNVLRPNLSSAEFVASPTNVDMLHPTATGFGTNGTYIPFSANTTYIYMAIRRPMKVPTDGTKVFKPVAYTGDDTTDRAITGVGFAGDLMIGTNRSGTVIGQTYDRLRGKAIQLNTNLTSAETNRAPSSEGFMGMDSFIVDYNGGRLNNYGINYISHLFKRAPGFFDVVCYTGTGVNYETVNHNLKVPVEFGIIKSRNSTGNWAVSVKPTGVSEKYGLLNTTGPVTSGFPTNGGFNPQWGTDQIRLVNGFSDGSNVNSSGTTYVAYLFASCPGVSKVGSYTGNGSSQTINCGFTNGSRFFLVKATSTTGNWWVYDSARGIVSSTDPVLALNSTAAEVTSADAVDPDSSGIVVNQEATCSINANGVSYIYLAIA